ncbi:MAG: hypothetical protein LBJ00_07490 [Planctomycetaceae bacterium]|nr:hypothetical protein [Planctomycetaceae bacterium]
MKRLFNGEAYRPYWLRYNGTIHLTNFIHRFVLYLERLTMRAMYQY